MKKLPLLLFIIISMPAFSQDVKEILKKAYDKCQSVKNGQYELTKHMKPMSGKDTTEFFYSCCFKKLTGDSLFSTSFHTDQIWHDTVFAEIIYTGNELIEAYRHDSTATIIAKDRWAAYIKGIRHNFIFYSPLTHKTSNPMPDSADFDNPDITFQYISEETVGSFPCYCIRCDVKPGPKKTGDINVIGNVTYYWINKNDFVPVQFSNAYDLVMNNDTMYQYEKYTLTKYELNNLQGETPLTMASVPKFYKLKDYEPYVAPELLKDTLAPGWSLKSVNHENINLKDLKGKLVLIDFFYRSCYPCMKALPVLQSLSEKYKNSGLMVIGIDPMDKNEDELKEFLSKRGVTYTILTSDRDLPKQYRVSGYPTMYLVGKDGKIISSEVGYSEGLEQSMKEMIKKNLLDHP